MALLRNADPINAILDTDEYQARLQAFAAQTPDYEDTINSDTARSLFVLPAVNAYIRRQPNGPRMGYFFAKNPSVLHDIQKLPPRRLLRLLQELWRLDARLARDFAIE